MKPLRVASGMVAVSVLLVASACASPQGDDALRQAVPPGFTPLFDGKTLDGWRGDLKLWSIRDGAIRGSADRRIEKSSFLIHDGEFANFELHFKYRITEGGNSGFQFRSRAVDEAGYTVSGYQANVVPADQLVRFGMIYENLGRNEIALLSERVEISNDGGALVRSVKGAVNPVKLLLDAYRPYPEWNDYVVIAYDNRIIHAINGYLALDAIDNDPTGAKSGLFALQIDSFGTPMQVEFKDIQVRPLAGPPDIEMRFVSNPGAPETTSTIPKRPGR